MAITGKEKKALKAQGQRLEVRVHFGKDGLNENAVKDLITLLAKDELVKIKLPRHGELPKEDFAKQIADACDAEFVSCVGFSALIYKKHQGIIAVKKKEF